MNLARIQSEWMNSKEVAEYLGISRKSVERLTYTKRLPSHKPKNFNKRYYLKSEVDKFITSGANN